ncbi:MAG TPA: hypothetical protein VFP10_08470 [Candidatus Eisenbacteria bacterium]|nr:hypothetical protein [Candidatus Eisenbacteria bacterium]
MRELPSRTVTFLFTDIEGATVSADVPLTISYHVSTKGETRREITDELALFGVDLEESDLITPLGRFTFDQFVAGEHL